MGSERGILMKDVRYGEIINEILTQMGLTRDTVEPEVLTSIKLRINQIQDFIFYFKLWEWRKQTFYLSTKAPITSATFTVTKGSKNVTASDSVITAIVRFGFLRINNVLYKIDPISQLTGTIFKLVANYPDDTEVSITAEIVFPVYTLDPEISSLISIENKGRELTLLNSEKLVKAKGETGEPKEVAIAGVTDFIFHEEGTVTMARGSTLVNGVSTNWTLDMEGQIFRVNEFAEPFLVQTFTNATTISIKDPYTGPSGAGKGYQIGPKNVPLLVFRNTPDDIYFMEGVGLAHSKRLIDDNDISRIPNHAPLLHGAVWLALHDQKNQNPFRIQQARADFERTLKQLEDSNKVITSIAWISQEELQARGASLVDAQDPLDLFGRR